MKFACESCRAQYMISDDKVGPRGVKVRCKKCGNVNIVRRQAPATDPDLIATAAPAPAPGGDLDDEIGAAFDNVLDDAPPRAAESAAVRSNSAFQTPVPGDEFGFAPGGEDLERTRLMDLPDLQRAFETHERRAEPPGAEAAAPPAAAMEWYVAVDDQQVGPLGLEEVRSRWDAGSIGPDTLCWRSGMADWTPLSQTAELADGLAPRHAPDASAAAGKGWIDAAMAPRPEPAPGWKPSAATALASLVEAELEASRQARPVEATLERDLPVGDESTGIRSLLRDLPETGVPAAELSRLLPLGAAAPAAAPAVVEKPSASTPRADAAPAAGASKGGGAGKWIAAAAVLLVVAGAAFFARGLIGGAAVQAPVAAAAPAVAAAAAPQPAPVAVVPPAPVEPQEALAAAPQENAGAGGAGATVGAGGAGGSAAVPAEAVAALAATPAAAAPEVEPTPEPAKAIVPARVEKARSRREADRPRMAAAPAPAPAPRHAAPAPAPPPRGSGDLLDAAGSNSAIDDLFAQEFSGSRGKPKPAPKNGGGTYIPPAPGSGGKPHQLSQGDIAGVVVGHKSQLKSCVTDYKTRTDGSSGTVVMRWNIEQDGRTSGVKPVKGAEHKELAGCIGTLVKGWKFPAYAGPRMTAIDFPFQF